MTGALWTEAQKAEWKRKIVKQLDLQHAFTRADVALLRALANDPGASGWDELWRLSGLADRIEALLPPE